MSSIIMYSPVPSTCWWRVVKSSGGINNLIPLEGDLSGFVGFSDWSADLLLTPLSVSFKPEFTSSVLRILFAWKKHHIYANTANLWSLLMELQYMIHHSKAAWPIEKNNHINHTRWNTLIFQNWSYFPLEPKAKQNTKDKKKAQCPDETGLDPYGTKNLFQSHVLMIFQL